MILPSVGAAVICSFALVIHTQLRPYLRRAVGRVRLGETVRMHLALIADGLQNGGDIGLEHHAAHDDLIENVMHAIRVKDEIELAYILEALVEGLYEDLDEIEDAEVGLLRVDGEDEEERGVVAVDELDVVAPFRDGALEVVAEVVGPLRHLREDAADDGLLHGLVLDGLVELGEAGFAVVVHDYHAFDHVTLCLITVILWWQT
mmetsp:Transcript_6494/g.17654  ORF Transcript_6494/g.17654 Transcript_6494/m.17654 type:complete len:204 (-) Transcript_6494:107-718(-)